eukprot:8581101-Pyramimonas_sp.AAC.1
MPSLRYTQDTADEFKSSQSDFISKSPVVDLQARGLARGNTHTAVMSKISKLGAAKPSDKYKSQLAQFTTIKSAGGKEPTGLEALKMAKAKVAELKVNSKVDKVLSKEKDEQE